MFGNNVIAPQIREFRGTYEVKEIFDTLQGEGPYSGRPAVFVRLAGCQLRCAFCDTNFDGGGTATVAQIMNAVNAAWRSPGRPFVVLTGGEPTRQPLDPLLREMTELNWRVQIETAGLAYWSEMAHPHVSVVVSPKTPTVNSIVEHVADAYKYVIRATDEICPETGIPVTATQRGARAARLATPPGKVPRERIYLSPCDEYDPEKNAANRAAVAKLATRFGYTAMIQLHKEMDLP